MMEIFLKDSIANRVNSDLSNNLGNLIQRVCSFIYKNCDKKVENNFDLNEDDKILITLSENKIDNYIELMNNQEIDKAIKIVFDLLTETNIYVDRQAPWVLKKKNINRMNVVLSISIELIKRCSFMLYPIIPNSCEKIFKTINIKLPDLNFKNIYKLPETSNVINFPEPIFPRIETND